VQEPNVDVHFTGVERITEKGVVGQDGIERECDTIVCATGFDVSYRPRFPIIGQNGTDLADKWKVCPEGYLGLAIPEVRFMSAQSMIVYMLTVPVPQCKDPQEQTFCSYPHQIISWMVCIM